MANMKLADLTQNMTDGKFTTHDGTQIHYYLVECENPKYVVQIAHGMEEYSRIYFEFANFLSKNNCIVFMIDQRGHGRTAKSLQHLMHVNGDIFDQTVKDHILISKMLKEKYNLPLILFGHSYGSFISQEYILNCDLADKVILSGSAYMKVPKIRLAKALSKHYAEKYGNNTRADIIERLTILTYAQRFANQEGSWITSDKGQSAIFYNDKYNGKTATYGFYKYMFTHQLKLYDYNKLKAAKNNAKILVASGDKDPIGESGRLVKRLYQNYKKYGFDVELKLYKDMRHGIVQEKRRDIVFKDILEFIQS